LVGRCEIERLAGAMDRLLAELSLVLEAHPPGDDQVAEAALIQTEPTASWGTSQSPKGPKPSEPRQGRTSDQRQRGTRILR
jgi:hypothetical protein